MKEKDTTRFLAEFDNELWGKFKEKVNPFGYSLKDLVRDLIKIFVGDLEGINPEPIEEIRKVLEVE